MSADEALLVAGSSGDLRGPVVRLYSWAAPALSVGAHLEVPHDVRSRCLTSDVQVVRRITGGGAVLHRGDLTYSVVAPSGGMSVSAAYEWVAQPVICGLEQLGVRAEIASRSEAGGVHMECFARPTGADLAVNGKKLVGSAQARRGRWFLQHGSLPIADLRLETALLLGAQRPDRSTWLEAEAPGVTFEGLRQALISGFVEVWGGPRGKILHR